MSELKTLVLQLLKCHEGAGYKIDSIIHTTALHATPVQVFYEAIFSQYNLNHLQIRVFFKKNDYTKYLD